MKILFYSDVHYCSYSSILRQHGDLYSKRLENCNQSVNWAEELASEQGCELIICAGDFFDKPLLSAQEISALTDIRWNTKLRHYFLVGNHEMSGSDNVYNSTNVLSRLEGFTVISEATSLEFDGIRFGFLPYILERHREALTTYFDNVDVIVSHNDIKNLPMGRIVSKEGIEITEIPKSCKLFMNGHLHNGTAICNNAFNIGNLTGQNFSEDAFNYGHGCIVLDTKDLSLQYFENPFAFNFYKVDYKKDLNFKPNAVVSCVTNRKHFEEAKNMLSSSTVAYKITIDSDASLEDNSEYDKLALYVDHIEKFKEFVKMTLGSDELIESELAALL